MYVVLQNFSMQGELYPYVHFCELWLYVNCVQIYDLGMFFSKKLKSNDSGIFNGFYKWNQLLESETVKN
jgi:hypothetical protein